MHKKSRLKDKIVTPYVMIILLMTVFVLITFNISMRVTLKRNAQNDINESRETAKLLLKRELKGLTDESSESGLLPKAEAVILAVNTSFRISEMASETEMALMNEAGKVILPKTTNLSEQMIYLTNAVAKKITSGNLSDTFDVTYDKQTFLVSFEKFNETKLAKKNQYLVIVASQESAESLGRRINILLLIIVSFVALLGVLSARKIARDITKPILEVSEYAKNISNGSFQPLKLKTDTIELDQLILNLNEMSVALQNKEQSKLDFLQNFSHDLRTPLMSIQGYAEGIATGVFPEATKPARIIASESIRLKHLVDQLITLSRLDTSPLGVTRETVELSPFLDSLIERYDGFATKEQKKIVVNCSRDFRIHSNEDLLEKIIGNILSNAIHYARTHVVVDVERNETKVQIRIQDDGPGIPVNLLPHIFDRFYKGNAGNFGLGLAIAETASKLLGSELKVENHALGAVFTLIIETEQGVK